MKIGISYISATFNQVLAYHRIKRFHCVGKIMAKPTVLLTRNDYPPNALAILKEKFDVEIWDKQEFPKEDLLRCIKGKFGIFCIPRHVIDKDVLNAAGPSLKVVATMSVGYEHLDVEEIKRRGIRIGYTPDVLTESVAEIAIALALSVGRHLFPSNREVLRGGWRSKFTPLWMCGQGLSNSTVGIIGLGRIGLSIAKKIIPFNAAKILYTSRSEKEEELIDQDALVEALQNNKIGGAGLDVTTPEPLPDDHPLLKLDNAGPNLKVVTSTSSGHDHLDVNEMRRRGIRVGYIPNAVTEAVAEHAIALALVVGRRLFEFNKKILSRNDLSICGKGLSNSTVGIVGLGRIGFSILKKLIPFNVARHFYTSRSEKQEGKNLGAIWMDIDDLIPECDFIFLTVNLSPETKFIINRKRIQRMKCSAIIINVSRGEVIEQDALIEALESKKIDGAGLDTMTPEPLPHNHPLSKLNNAVLTPHIAFYTHDSHTKSLEDTVTNVMAVLKGTNMASEL